MTTCWGWKAPICSEHSHMEQVTQDHAQSGFEYLQRRGLCNFSRQPAPVFNPLYTKGVFLYFTCNLMYFKLCLLPLVLMLCTTKEWYSVFFAPPVKYWYTLLRLIWVFSSMKSKSFFRLYPYAGCSKMSLSSWLDLLQLNEPLQYSLLWDNRMSDLELTCMLNIKHVPNHDS